MATRKGRVTVVGSEQRLSGHPDINAVRYTLLAPRSRLTPEEAAALLRLPRRVLRAEHEWFAPGLGELTGQPPLELLM